MFEGKPKALGPKASHSGRNEAANRPKTFKLPPDSGATLHLVKDNKVARTVAAQEKHHGQAHRSHCLTFFDSARHDDPCRSVTLKLIVVQEDLAGVEDAVGVKQCFHLFHQGNLRRVPCPVEIRPLVVADAVFR